MGIASESSFKTLVFILLTILISLHSASSLGKKTFGEACSIGGALSSIFSTEREDRTCAGDQGLICTGKCTCPLGRVWESSASVFGKPADSSDPGCFRAAGAPCFGSSGSSSQSCVFNGHCEFGFCICNPGYKAKRGHCVKSYNSEDDNENSSEEGGNKDDQGSKRPSLSEIFNNINNFFRPDRPNNENRFPNSRPGSHDFSGFPITRPATDQFDTFPITRPAQDQFEMFPITRPVPDEFNGNFPNTRPFPEDSDGFYNERPFHADLSRPIPDSSGSSGGGSRVVFPSD